LAEERKKFARIIYHLPEYDQSSLQISRYKLLKVGHCASDRFPHAYEKLE